jgi:hypothetical protein
MSVLTVIESSQRWKMTQTKNKHDSRLLHDEQHSVSRMVQNYVHLLIY